MTTLTTELFFIGHQGMNQMPGTTSSKIPAQLNIVIETRSGGGPSLNQNLKFMERQ